MRDSALSFLALSFTLAAGYACSSSSEGPNTNMTGSGGSSIIPGGSGGTGDAAGGQSGGGGTPGSGGSSNTGAGGSTGGPDGSGGSNDPAGSGGGGSQSQSICPPGSEALTPSMEGKTLALIEGVPEVPGFLEGPVWFGGKLYLSQVHYNTGDGEKGDILAYTPGSGFAQFPAGIAAGTNGMAISAQGTLYAASHVSSGIISFDVNAPSTPSVPVATMYEGKPYNSPNDITVRSDGTIYFTDPANNCQTCAQSPVEGVYRQSPGGQPEIIAYEGKPNGIALSPDEKTLYVGGATLRAYPVMADGSVGAGAPFGGITGTDGLGVDCAGNVYAALYNMGQVIAVSPAGTAIAGSLAVSEVTNIAFGGPERKTMFITSFGDNRGQLRTVEMEVPGLPF